MNFHAKSEVSSSKNGLVMSTFVLMYFFVLLYFCNLFGLSIRTSMQNFRLLAQKLSELCSILFSAPCRPSVPVTNLPVELGASRQLKSPKDLRVECLQL